MLHFNGLLRDVGIDPAETRLVRHRHSRRQGLVYSDAIGRRPRFEEYQASQGKPVVIQQMTSAKVIAAFVADPTRGDTVFVGLWEVGANIPRHTPDPYDPQPPVPDRSYVTIELSRMSELDIYAGRLVVDWGKSERAWVQYAHRRNKEIVELRRQIEEPAFPGFGPFRCPLNEVEALPAKWLEVLRLTRGVYLLVHRSTGAQYVGSAIGADGFIGRWRGYSAGHGGNVAMKELGHPAAEYDVAVLDTVGHSATPDDIYQLESSWKIKLGSRAQGLNRN